MYSVLAVTQLYISFVLRSLHYKEETRQAVGDSVVFLVCLYPASIPRFQMLPVEGIRKLWIKAPGSLKAAAIGSAEE